MLFGDIGNAKSFSRKAGETGMYLSSSNVLLGLEVFLSWE